MKQKIWSLIASIGAIVLGIYLTTTTSSVFYGLILVGALYGIYDIYLIATHKRKEEQRRETEQKLAQQTAFGNAPPAEAATEPLPTAAPGGDAECATIIVHWFQEKMGAGALPVTVNGVSAGTIKKGNLQVVYRTNVPFNVVGMGIYKAEIELSPGDTVEYFVAGNGIRHSRTIVTPSAK